MDNLLPQTLKSRLLIPDYDSSDNSDKDVVHKEYVESKTFTLDVSKGLDMKGNKVINIAAQHVQQMEAMQGMLIQKRAII